MYLYLYKLIAWYLCFVDDANDICQNESHKTTEQHLPFIGRITAHSSEDMKSKRV